MAMGVVGLKFTDTLTFEVGGGFRSDDVDFDEADADEAWTIYGQAVITMARACFLIRKPATWISWTTSSQ